MTTPALIVIGISVLGLLAVPVAYLTWQSTVRPYRYEDLFVLPTDSDQGGREIALEGAFNFRDLGGYHTAEGRRVREGLLYRSAFLQTLSDADLATLQGLGLRRIYDLRTPVEVAAMPDRVPPGIERVALPIHEHEPITRLTVMFNRHRLLELFARVYVEVFIDQGAAVYGRLLRDLSQPENTPALIHCTAGKDRTGIAAALILSVLGVPREMVLADYLASNRHAGYWLREVEKQLVQARTRGVNPTQLWPMIASSPELINPALDHIETRYGGVEAYLLGPAGLSPEDIARLRSKLIEG